MAEASHLLVVFQHLSVVCLWEMSIRSYSHRGLIYLMLAASLLCHYEPIFTSSHPSLSLFNCVCAARSSGSWIGETGDVLIKYQWHTWLHVLFTRAHTLWCRIILRAKGKHGGWFQATGSISRTPPPPFRLLHWFTLDLWIWGLCRNRSAGVSEWTNIRFLAAITEHVFTLRFRDGTCFCWALIF